MIDDDWERVSRFSILINQKINMRTSRDDHISRFFNFDQGNELMLQTRTQANKAEMDPVQLRATRA